MSGQHNVSRRRFMATAAGGLIGASLPAKAYGTARAKSVIHLFMSGGMSHLDTFDPKPGIRAIPTYVPGVSISANLPRLAERMAMMTIFRSMSHGSKNHQEAQAAALGFPPEWSFIAARETDEAIVRVESGCRFVRMEIGGWDTHTESARRAAERCSILDKELSGLLDGLSVRGLLDETLVVLSTEFGRSARINGFGGRNHHPHAYSCLMAGGGTQGGRVIGATSDDGMVVIGKTISPWKFNSMVANRLGMQALA